MPKNNSQLFPRKAIWDPGVCTINTVCVGLNEKRTHVQPIINYGKATFCHSAVVLNASISHRKKQWGIKNQAKLWTKNIKGGKMRICTSSAYLWKTAKARLETIISFLIKSRYYSFWSRNTKFMLCGKLLSEHGVFCFCPFYLLFNDGFTAQCKRPCAIVKVLGKLNVNFVCFYSCCLYFPAQLQQSKWKVEPFPPKKSKIWS